MKTLKTWSVSALFIFAAGCSQADVISTNKHQNLNTKSESEIVSVWQMEANALLRSEAFHQNLVSLEKYYPHVWVSNFMGERSPSELSQILKLNDRNKPDAWWVSTGIELKGQAIRDDKDPSGFVRDSAGQNQYVGAGWSGNTVDGKSTGLITMGRIHLARYKSQDLVERSCALNTLSHEITHTLSHRKNQYVEYFLDSSVHLRQTNGRPAASYLLGTVAQCTYLTEAGRIELDGFFDCVETFADPTLDDPFQSFACNNFPGSKPVTPAGRDTP